jgi:hypothetical protein
MENSRWQVAEDNIAVSVDQCGSGIAMEEVFKWRGNLVFKKCSGGSFSDMLALKSAVWLST